MILGIIAVVLVATVVAYLVFRVVRHPTKRVAASIPTTMDPTPSTTTTTLPGGPAITQAQLDQLLVSLIPFVERTRQLRFTTVPRPLVETSAAYDKAFGAQVALDDPLMTRLSTPFRILGLNPNDLSLTSAARAFYGSRTVVFYDTKHNLIHVRATPNTPYLSAVLVVALTEQLDDQHFDLDRAQKLDTFGDGVVGLRSLAQGDGWRIASAWTATQSNADQVQINAELRARRGSDGDTTRVPPVLAGWLRLPIDEGVNFTSGLTTSTSSAPLDAAFTNPPDGSAQVLYPARFAAPIPQLPVAAPKVEGAVKATGTFGQYYLNALLQTVVSDQTLPVAISGYRGDTMVVYAKGSGSCLRMDVTTGDSSVTNLRTAIETWASKRDAKVSVVADALRRGHQVIRLDACTPGAGQSGDSTTTVPERGTRSSTTLPGRPKP